MRTAFEDGAGGAHISHDANFLTFHRWPEFRRLTLSDSVAEKSPQSTASLILKVTAKNTQFSEAASLSPLETGGAESLTVVLREGIA